MSERLNSWDANQAAHDRERFEDELFGEAGKSDFSEEARTRAEEAGAYEDHLESVQGRGDDYDVMSDGRMDSVDRDIQADPRLRRAAMIASNVRELGNREISSADADQLSERYEELQDKLADLLSDFDTDSTLHQIQKEEIMSRIIDMTTEAPADSATNESLPVEHAVADSQETSAENKPTDEEGSTNEKVADDEVADDKGAAEDIDDNDTNEMPKMIEDEIRAKRAKMVQEGIAALDVGNMSDDDIVAYNLVEKPPVRRPIVPATVINKEGNGSTAETTDTQHETGSELGVQDTLPGFEDVDMGEDIEDLPEDGGEKTQDLGGQIMGMGTNPDDEERQGFGRRMREEARGFMKNWRHPVAYLAARNQTARFARAEARANGEYNGNRRRNIIAGVFAGAALTGAVLWMRYQGHDVPSVAGQGVPSSVTPDMLPEPQPNGVPATLETLDFPATELVTVNPGDGEIKVAQHILEQHGITVDASVAEEISNYAGVDLLQANRNYDDTLSELSRIGGRAGEYRTQPGAAQALVEAARELGY